MQGSRRTSDASYAKSEGATILCAALVMVPMNLAVRAQGIDGVLRGQVSDKATGAPIPSVQITARNTETAFSLSVVANAAGFTASAIYLLEFIA